MAWTSPLTAVSNAALTAAQWNASVRDNLLETAPAKATGVAAHFVTAGTNTIAQRQAIQDGIDTLESSTATSFGNLATVGPTVTVTCSLAAMAFYGTQINASAANAYGIMSYDCDAGATFASADTNCVMQSGSSASSVNRAGATDLRVMSAASHTFKAEYRTNGVSIGFLRRRLTILAF